jgi:large subunit ribosomal protein L17
MRHRVVKTKLSRDVDHRVALLKNLCVELISHEKVETTLVKAKAVKPVVEKMITKARKYAAIEDPIKRFNIVKELRKDVASEEVIRKLVSDLGTRYKSRNGGYTKIVRTGNRPGDNAIKARIELVKETKTTKTAKKVTKEENAQ